MPTVEHVPVVIVGGGPVGLSASLLLSRLGVPSVLLERRSHTSPLPRARGMNVRTSEIWRLLGLSEAMEAISLAEEWTRCILYVTRLAGAEIGRMPSESMARAQTARYSPAPFLCSSQDRIDSLLRGRASDEPGAEVRFGHAVVGVEPADDGVTVAVDGPDGTYRLAADWVIAADGASSFVRQELGVELVGARTNRWYLNVHFSADLSQYTRGDRKSALIWTLDSAHEGVFQALDGKRDWGCGVNFDSEEVDPSTFDAPRVLDLIRDMIDDPAPDIDLELIAFRPWFVSSTVAERFRVGRVLLAGDAAHQIPPFGGQGMNTGVQDAHNLAWKLAAVRRGADDALLDTYEVERREVAERICAFGRRNVGHVTSIRSGQSDREVQVAREYGNWSGIDVGAHYNAGALLPDGSPVPETEESVIAYEPVARPGWRFPHHWVDVEAGRRSTIDWFVDDMVLVTGPSGDAWSVLRGVDVRREGRDFTVASGSGLHERLGVGPDGAVLVRPDGHVAARWSSAPPDPGTALAAALTSLHWVALDPPGLGLPGPKPS